MHEEKNISNVIRFVPLQKNRTPPFCKAQFWHTMSWQNLLIGADFGVRPALDIWLIKLQFGKCPLVKPVLLN